MMSNQAQARRNAFLILVTLLCAGLALVNIMQGNVFFYISIISLFCAGVMRILAHKHN